MVNADAIRNDIQVKTASFCVSRDQWLVSSVYSFIFISRQRAGTNYKHMPKEHVPGQAQSGGHAPA